MVWTKRWRRRRPGQPSSSRSRALPEALWLTDAHLALAEKAVENLARLRTLALGVTCEHDWLDISGRPYLTAAGALKIAALFNISLTEARVEEARDTLGDSVIVRFSVTLRARYLGREVDVVGGASSDDGLFSKRDGKAVPLTEVNLTSVRKKAFTNAQSRAVKTLLGLTGLTWEELSEAGLSVAVPRRKLGDRAREAGPAKPVPAVPPTRARERLEEMLLAIATCDGEPVEALLRHYTEFEGKSGQTHWAKSVEQMSDAWVARIYERVEKDWASPKGQRSFE